MSKDDRTQEVLDALASSLTVCEAAKKLGIADRSVRKIVAARGLGPASRLLAQNGALAHGSKSTEAATRAAKALSDQRRAEREREARDERRWLVDALDEANRRQAFIDKIARDHRPPEILAREKSGGAHEVAAVVLASDWHVEETVDPVSVAGRNRFNLEIAERRIERFFNGVVYLVEHHRADGVLKIDDMVLALLGDFMTGYIHEENVETSQMSPVETVRWLIPRLRDGIVTLLDRLKLRRLVVPCSHGNHGRTTDRIRVATGAKNSFEWLMYVTLSELFRADKRVTFEITQSEHQYVRVYDWWLHFHHGHELKYQGGVGGIGIPLLKAVADWDRVKPCKLHCIGHWHTRRDFESALVNGSLIGFNAYAMKIRASYEEPQQTMFLLDPKRGKSTVEPVWVSENGKAAS